MLFSDKKELLGLYNAVSGKQYKDPGALNVNTLENAIYMAIKNDLSFVIDSRLSLYEHQSTYSPKLPLRMLLYLADLYADLMKNENLYGRKKMMLNINAGHNPELMRACKTLADYAQYTARIRRYAAEMPIEEAVGRTITECIREGILEDFLRKYRAEAKRMSIYEYDQARHIRQETEEAREEGRQEGTEEGRQKERQEEKRAIALNLVKMGMTAEQIAQAVEEEPAVVEEWLRV